MVMAPGGYIPGAYGPEEGDRAGSWREQAACGLVFVLSHISNIADQRPADEEAAASARAALSSLIPELGKPHKPGKPRREGLRSLTPLPGVFIPPDEQEPA